MFNGAFHRSIRLKLTNFPELEGTSWGIFIGCSNLETVSFGTAFEEQKEINFGHSVFGDIVNITIGLFDTPVSTDKVKLTLGENVLPSPNLLMNAWQGTNMGYNDYAYTWKSINIDDGGIEEEPSNTSDIL